MNPPPSDPDLFVSFRDCHLLILKMVQGHSGLGPETAMYHVTRILLSAREDIKYSPRAIILLIGMQIVDMKQLDEHLAKVGGGRGGVSGWGGRYNKAADSVIHVQCHAYIPCIIYTMYVFEYL